MPSWKPSSDVNGKLFNQHLPSGPEGESSSQARTRKFLLIEKVIFVRKSLLFDVWGGKSKSPWNTNQSSLVIPKSNGLVESKSSHSELGSDIEGGENICLAFLHILAFLTGWNETTRYVSMSSMIL